MATNRRIPIQLDTVFVLIYTLVCTIYRSEETEKNVDAWQNESKTFRKYNKKPSIGLIGETNSSQPLM